VARRRFVKITEAAEILGIGRTAAYDAAKRYRETGGAEGIAVVAVGGSLRVPVAWLEQMAGGPIELEVAPAPFTSRDVRRTDTPFSGPEPEPTRSSRRPARRSAQHQLPFTG